MNGANQGSKIDWQYKICRLVAKYWTKMRVKVVGVVGTGLETKKSAEIFVKQNSLNKFKSTSQCRKMCST